MNPPGPRRREPEAADAIRKRSELVIELHPADDDLVAERGALGEAGWRNRSRRFAEIDKQSFQADRPMLVPHMLDAAANHPAELRLRFRLDVQDTRWSRV